MQLTFASKEVRLRINTTMPFLQEGIFSTEIPKLAHYCSQKATILANKVFKKSKIINISKDEREYIFI